MRLKEQIWSLFEEGSEEAFNNVAIEVFKVQSKANPVYKRFLDLINYSVIQPKHYNDIPLMPISFYKHHAVKTGLWEPQKIFKSSGTTQSLRSLHHVSDLNWYKKISVAIFEESRLCKALGIESKEKESLSVRPREWPLRAGKKGLVVLGLLPSYIENGDSSLVYMVDHFAKTYDSSEPYFYLHNHKELAERIQDILLTSDDDILLFGVTFALLDFAKEYSLDNSRLTIVFTGGMKNKRAEMFTKEINERLKSMFPSSLIASEYGMTEMLSQAYALEDGQYHMPSSLRIVPKEINDPLTTYKHGKTAIMGLIDLANCDSLSFILTEDLGVVYPDNKFDVLGRLQVSDLRGCNLLYNPQEYG